MRLCHTFILNGVRVLRYGAGASTLHLQVSADSSADPWQCPSKLPPHFANGSEPGYAAPSDLKRLSVGGEFVVGEFVHADGRQAVMVQNFDHTLSAMPTLVRSSKLLAFPQAYYLIC